jgi:hypothetical protein
MPSLESASERKTFSSYINTQKLSDGALNEWIGYAPTLKEGEGLDI